MKIIAAIFMLMDHIGMLFYPTQPLWRALGRLAMPLFAYGVASGFWHTSSLKNYMKRMTVFAIISQSPFLWMFQVAYGRAFGLNIGFTFLIALGCLWLLKSTEQQSEAVKIGNYIMIGLLLILAEGLACDYGMYGVAVVILFYEYSFKKENQLVAYILFSLLTLLDSLIYNSPLQIYAVLSIVFIILLKNKRLSGLRYFFYLFYPLHMFVLVFIKLLFF